VPVERRIREGTQRNAAVLDPDVDRALGVVVRRARRRVLVRRSLTAAVSVPAVVIAIVLGPRLLDVGERSGPVRLGNNPSSSVRPSVTPPQSPLAGTFTRTVRSDRAVVRANGIAGRWTIETDAAGRTRLVAPPSFAGASVSPPFVVQGNELRTGAFAGGLCRGLPAGTYTWTKAGTYLVLSPVSDPCDARAWVLAQGPWRMRS